uniref:Uncharacterized protein n=1 Tax=Arundo donax TaxID=35708 RepID=A0A0A9GYV9_ARUDO
MSISSRFSNNPLSKRLLNWAHPWKEMFFTFAAALLKKLKDSINGGRTLGPISLAQHSRQG